MLLLLACLHPAASPPPGPPPVPAQPTEPSALLWWMLGEDPLARHVREPDASLLVGGDFEGQTVPAGVLPAVIQTALTVPLPGWEAEAGLRGSLGLPLLRGRRLAELEVEVGGALPVESLRLLAPMLAPTLPPPSPSRPLLDWMGNPGGEGLLIAAERNVLLGWLDAPGPNLQPLASLLQDLRFDRLTASPAGALLLARALSRRDPVALQDGLRRLDAGTRLSLLEVAADTAAEQTALRQTRSEAVDTWKLQGDPANALLAGAQASLAKDAGEDATVGLSLVAQAGLRWRDACPDPPCGGLDRPLALDAAARWGSLPSDYSEIWRLIFWKDAVDHLEATQDRASAIYAQDAIVELVAPQLEPRILLMPAPGPPSLLAISRALGDSGRTDATGLLQILKLHLAEIAENLEKRNLGDAEAVHRIAVRARDEAQ